MPAFKVQIGEESYRLDFPNEPSSDEMQAAVANLTAPAAASPPEPPPATVTASGTQEEGHPYLATAARIGFPIAGGVAGALSPIPGGAYVGGGLAGAAGEALAQYLEGTPLDAKHIALQGTLAAVPFVGKARTPLAGAVLRSAEGATLGGVGSAARDWLDDRAIDLTGVLRGSALGGLFGAGGGALEGTLARRATLANLALDQPPEAPRTVPGVFGLGEHAEVPAADVGGLDYPPPFPVEQPAHPTLGQMGLPGPLGLGEAPEVGALSARTHNELAPSIIDHVETTDDLKAIVNGWAAQNSAGIEEARRGVQTTAAREAAARPLVLELAQQLGTSPESFVKTFRKRGEALNAEQLEAVKMLHTAVTGDFYDVAKQMAAGDTDPQTYLRLAKAIALAKGTLSQKAGAAAESGRSLNALRGTQRMERLQGKVLEALLSKAGTSEDALRDIATKAADLADGSADPAVLTKFLRDVTESTTEDKIHEAWMSGLMGVKTQIINNMSNALALGVRLPEEALAGSLDALRASVTGSPRERFVGETVADSLGMARGLMGGARAALRAFKTEMPQWNQTQRMETRSFGIKGTPGKVIRTNLRMLLAADEFWKAFGGEGAMYAQAYREAAQEGHAGTARFTRMTDLLANERGRLKETVTPEVLYRTFQAPSDLATRAIGLREWKVPGIGLHPFRWLFPFVHTPLNVATFGAERTPLGLFSTLAKAFTGRSAGDIEDSAARAIVGTGLAGAVVAHAASGGITGDGPSDRGERAALLATGWQPDSVKIGNRYYSYNRLEPLGSMLSFAANTAEAMRDPLVSPGEAAARVSAQFVKRLSDLPFLTGLQTVMDAREDPGRFGPAFVKRFASSFIPTMMAEAARANDPTMRDTSTFGNLLQSRIPGLSEKLPPLRNVWGEPISLGEGGVSTVLPMQAGPAISDDPASVEVRRLVTHAGLSISSPARAFKTKGEADPLTPEEYDHYTQQAGALAKQLVTKVVTSPTYQRIASDEKRARIVQNIIGKARDMARIQLKVQRARHQGGVPLSLGGP